jgi:transcriptional regulator with XRE-family HTH domain
VDIGKRLRELRKAKGLSQGDVEHRSGLLRCYQSGVENGRATPTVRVLERWAKAVDVELYQIFFDGRGQPEAPELQDGMPVGAQSGPSWSSSAKRASRTGHC